jgi:hypothetical protein
LVTLLFRIVVGSGAAALLELFDDFDCLPWLRLENDMLHYAHLSLDCVRHTCAHAAVDAVMHMHSLLSAVSHGDTGMCLKTFVNLTRCRCGARCCLLMAA